MGIGDNSKYFTLGGGLPNCTTYVGVRCEEEHLPTPASGNAQDWPDPGHLNTAEGGYVFYSGAASRYTPKYGDVVVSKAQHHVCFVNSDGTVSGSGYMSNLYLDSACTVYSPGTGGVPGSKRGDRSFGSSVYNRGGRGNDSSGSWDLTQATYRSGVTGSYRSTAYYFYHKNSLSYEGGGSGTIYVLRCKSTSPSGSGSGDSDTSGGGGGGGSDGGQESGGGGSEPGWYPSFGTIPETDCGTAPAFITGETYDTGSQDNPKIPAVYSHNDGTREDGGGNPLITHTYERVFLFDKDGSGNGHGSDGVETKSYSQSYGEQDTPDKPMPSGVGTKNEGGVMDWD